MFTWFKRWDPTVWMWGETLKKEIASVSKMPLHKNRNRFIHFKCLEKSDPVKVCLIYTLLNSSRNGHTAGEVKEKKKKYGTVIFVFLCYLHVLCLQACRLNETTWFHLFSIITSEQSQKTELPDIKIAHVYKTVITGTAHGISYYIILLLAVLPFHCLAVQLHNTFKSLFFLFDLSLPLHYRRMPSLYLQAPVVAIWTAF